jgi:hypothetical protein
VIGAGGAQKIVGVGGSAVVDCVAEVPRYCPDAVQDAVSKQVPVDATIFTVVPTILHAPLAVIDGVTPELEVATTVKVEYSGAVAGAPVKLTVGAVCGAKLAVTDWGAFIRRLSGLLVEVVVPVKLTK